MTTNNCWEQIDKLSKEGKILQFQEEVKLVLEGDDAYWGWGLFLAVKGSNIKSNYWTINVETKEVNFRFKGDVDMAPEIKQSTKLFELVIELLDEYKADATIDAINKISNPLVTKKTGKKRKPSQEFDTSALSNEEKVRILLRQKPQNL
jgi:hypothetical protein